MSLSAALQGVAWGPSGMRPGPRPLARLRCAPLPIPASAADALMRLMSRKRLGPPCRVAPRALNCNVVVVSRSVARLRRAREHSRSAKNQRHGGDLCTVKPAVLEESGRKCIGE